MEKEKPKGKKPYIRLYVQDENGKIGKESAIALWKNIDKNGNPYLNGTSNDKKVKYVGFISDEST